MLTIYIAGSFKHKHGVRLLGRELRALGCRILDWTDKAVPPAGLTPAQRRIWMDTDHDGGAVYAFCRDACRTADLVIYYGASGQDAGVEVGLAAGAGTPVLGVCGPLEGPGLMLHGAVDCWVDSIEEALEAVAVLVAAGDAQGRHGRQDRPEPSRSAPLEKLCRAVRARRAKGSAGL